MTPLCLRPAFLSSGLALVLFFGFVGVSLAEGSPDGGLASTWTPVSQANTGPSGSQKGPADSDSVLPTAKARRSVDSRRPKAGLSRGIGTRSRARLRRDLLLEVLLDGQDPETCFLNPRFELPGQSGSGVASESIDALLREVLGSVDSGGTRGVALSRVERNRPRSLGTTWFGASDHFVHPSTDLYRNPKKALTGGTELRLHEIDPADFDYPIVVNGRVKDWMVYFLTRGRTWFVKWIARSERYIPLIHPRLEEAGLPRDLVYQAMIESGFNPYATSHASAVGVWQFISATGRAYGLNRDWWMDQRRDPVQATGAAIALMTDLYKQFGSWELASAAYNAGSGKISRAIKTYGTDNYWELVTSGRDYLKPETKNYVPKIIAASILAKYADRYGLRAEIKDEDRLPLWEHDVVSVPEATDLQVVAGFLEVSLEELESINPALKRGYTPPAVENYPLNLPLGSKEAFSRKFARLSATERVTFVRHRVRRGETLGAIARRYSVPVPAISKMNGIRDPRRLRVGSKLVIPVRAKNLGSRQITHIVASGETLGGIAQRYGMTLFALRDANRLHGDGIKVGQKIKVTTADSGSEVARSDQPSRRPASSASAPKVVSSRQSAKKAPRAKKVWHTVKRGDSLYAVAGTHGLTLSELRSLNGLSRSSVIHPGDRLRLRPAPPADPTTVYRVQRGDTVWGIARRYGMTSSQLRELNRLKSDRISPGQSLTVFASGKGGSPALYTVKGGDTLYDIARAHRVTVDSLRRWNDLSASTIRPGQSLTLWPGQNARASRQARHTIDYQVESGDTLGAISRKYGVTVPQLMDWNALQSHRIRPGQKLQVRLQ